MASVTYLVVAGGGSGAANFTNNSGAAGGGAGGLLTSSTTFNAGTSYTVTVGTGGTGTVPESGGQQGGNSVVSGSGLTTITATGGGAGGSSGGGGGAGGSGGGGGAEGGAGGTATSSPTQGHNGGNGTASTGSGSQRSAGGGGGAGGVGANAVATVNAAGGIGTSSSISGSSVTYAAGGNGGAASSPVTGASGAANTGNGGAGSISSGSVAGGNGGSGVVIFSSTIGNFAATTSGANSHIQSGGNDIWTFTSSGTWTPVVPTTNLTPSVTDSTAVSDTPTIEIVSNINVTDQTAMSESYGIGTPIKFDNAASFSSLVSSISGTYTTAGTNRALVAFVYSVTVPFSINPPTYNGAVMENVAEIQLPAGYSGFLAAYYLPNPAVGANTFAVSASGVAAALYASVMSYDSVSPDSDIDDFAFSTALLVNSITETLTSDLNGEWDFLGVVSGLAATLSAGTGSTLRTNVSPLAAFDSNGSVGPANTTYSMTANSSSSVDGLTAIMFSLEPYIWFQSKPSILLSEDIFVLDAPTLEIISSISVSDSTAVSDSPTIAIVPAPFNVNVSDSTAVSDTPTIQKILLISVSDFTPSSGPNYPTSGANQTGVGTIAWTNPNNIIFGSGSFAFVTLVSCFIAGTLITTPNGFKTIETIQNGDEIIADDGTTIKVKVTFVHRASGYLKIKTAKYSIGTTGNHPFLTPSGQVRAGELKTGDSVFTTDGVDIIESIINIPDTVDVYDLTVEDPHTYIADGFFVHNKP